MGMWLVPVALCILFGYVAFPVIFKKKLTQHLSVTRMLSWQFFFCFLTGLAVFFIFERRLPEPSVGIAAFMGIGVLNSYGAYCQWKAGKIAIGKMYLMTQLDDVIALTLGYTLLHENAYLTDARVIGMALCIGAGISFSIVRGKFLGAVAPSLAILKWIAIYSVIWGVAAFLRGYYARIEVLPWWHFLVGWYGGTYLGSLGIRFILRRTEAGPPLRLPDLKIALTAGVLVNMSLVMNFISMGLQPITVVQPIYLIAEMAFPTIMAIQFFKEEPNLRWIDRAILGVSGIGILLIAFGG